jgi:hypothetical protein
MEFLKIHLDVGESITAYALQASWLHSLPTNLPAQTEFTDSYLRELLQRMHRIFGDWPVHVASLGATFAGPDPGTTLEGKSVPLPRVEFGACFEGGHYVTSSPDGTDVQAVGTGKLVFVWHQEDLIPMLSDENRARIARLAWPNLARRFDYIVR